jgi:hypothetical protein
MGHQMSRANKLQGCGSMRMGILTKPNFIDGLESSSVLATKLGLIRGQLPVYEDAV